MNKVVIITGAARGIGLATAKIFLDQNGIGWEENRIGKEQYRPQIECQLRLA